jgi:hypothetical protein
VLADDVDVAIEVRPEELEHPAKHHSPFRGAIPEDDRDVRIAAARTVVAAVVRKDNLQMVLLALSNAVDDTPDQRSNHGELARSAVRAFMAAHLSMRPPKSDRR